MTLDLPTRGQKGWDIPLNAVLQYLDVTDSASPARAALTGLFASKAAVQTAESSPVVLFTVTPKTAGNELFQVHANSFPNLGAGAGTYNHAVHLGFNASRHSNGPGTVNGKPAIYMGFEDNYFDYAGDLRYGVEWYVGYASPDGVTVPVTALRPFYARVMSDSNAARSATIYMEIGTDSDGSWQVRKQVADPLLNIMPTSATFYVPLTVVGNTTTFQSNAGSGATVLINAAAFHPAIVFQRAGAASWAMQAESVGAFEVYDKNNRKHFSLVQGTTVDLAQTTFHSQVYAEGGVFIPVVVGSSGANLDLQLRAGGTSGGVLFRNGGSTATILQLDNSGNIFTGNGASIVPNAVSGLKIGNATSSQIGFWNHGPVVQPSGTPAAATDLATALTLVNSLRTSLLSCGLVA